MGPPSPSPVPAQPSPAPTAPRGWDHFLSPLFPESPDLTLVDDEPDDDWPLPPSFRRAASAARLLKLSCFVLMRG